MRRTSDSGDRPSVARRNVAFRGGAETHARESASPFFFYLFFFDRIDEKFDRTSIKMWRA